MNLKKIMKLHHIFRQKSDKIVKHEFYTLFLEKIAFPFSVTFNDKFVFIPTLEYLHRWDLIGENFCHSKYIYLIERQ